MGAEKTVQLNIRMQKELRDAGTAALQSKGINPSSYIRALWKKAALRGKDLDEVVQIIMPQKEAEAQNATVQEADALFQGKNLFKDALNTAGIDFNTCIKTDERSYSEILDEARYEVFAQKGLIS